MKTANYIMFIVWLCVLMFFVLSCAKRKETEKYIMPTEKEQMRLESLVSMERGYPDYTYNVQNDEFETCMVREDWYNELSKK